MYISPLSKNTGLRRGKAATWKERPTIKHEPHELTKAEYNLNILSDMVNVFIWKKRKSKDEITVSALVKITDANMDIVYEDVVTKMQQEVTVQQIMSQIANVKKDMIILEKSEFSALRAENEKINVELHRLKQQIMDEVIKVRTDTKLDFNLEKSRVKELYSLNERKLLEMRTEMMALHAQQDRAVTQTDRKIDTEVAGLKTMLESHKLDNIKYLAGSVFTCLTVALGFYCLWI
uniref:Mitochondrial calcium uniporter regulator 1 n=2 Tax=Canis lupus TaxID=9612 RepID=A0A8C0L9U5_CANLU